MFLARRIDDPVSCMVDNQIFSVGVTALRHDDHNYRLHYPPSRQTAWLGEFFS